METILDTSLAGPSAINSAQEECRQLLKELESKAEMVAKRARRYRKIHISLVIL